jgi:translation elongation factor EF-Tu-like GTPase
MIERNLLDQTKDLRGPQRMVQSNFGMLMEDQRRIAEQGLSQNNRVGRKAIQDDAQPIFGINLNQPYCCLITLQEENFLEVVAV